MKLIIKGIILGIILLNFVGTKVLAQCEITAIANPSIICKDDSVVLTSFGGCSNILTDNNFNDTTIGTGWISSNQAQFNNPCGPGLDWTIYLWFGDSSEFPRYIESIDFDVIDGGTICFDIKFAIQSESSPCEGPDLPDEGVHLQYSINGGASWVTIFYFNPDIYGEGGYGPTYTSWQNYCFDIPLAAQTTSTRFRLAQLSSTNEIYDHWGIDNIEISGYLPSQTVTVSWSHGPTEFNPPPVYPFSDTTFIVTVSDSIYSVTDTVNIIVHPAPILNIIGLESSYYETDLPDTLSGTPAGGVFSGNGISGNIFYPAIAGPGIHDITYTYYTLDSFLTTGMQAFWEDDFSTDIGWAGYGSGGWDRASATASSGCSGNQDPSTDHSPGSDNFIIGTYIGACYPNNLDVPHWLTSPVIDCSGKTNIKVEFFSKSGCESSSFDNIYFDVFNGSTWANIYSNTSSFSESSWTLRTYDVSAFADNNPDFQVRFGIGPTDGSIAYMGWNIDDLKLLSDAPFMVTDTVCTHSTTYTTTVILQTGINNIISDSNYSIYPNPTNNKIFIELSNPDLFNKIEVINIIGKTLYQTNNISKINSVDLSKFGNGVYLVKLHSKSNVYYHKVIFTK